MRYMLRAYVEAGLGPRASLRLAGRVLGPTQDDLFTTVAVAIYDPIAVSLTYATAGHPPPLTGGIVTHAALQTCASPALGWGVPAGRRQTTIPFPKGARACFFSDGLTEARGDDCLLGRDGLARLLTELGPETSAQDLLERVRAHAREIRDDMAACIVAPDSGSAACNTVIEELELELSNLKAQTTRFLTACRVAAEEIPPVVERARAVATEHGAALLTITADPTSSTAAVSPSHPPSFEAPVMTGSSSGENGTETLLPVAPPLERTLASQV
jgi:hypothetical protein